MWINSPGGDVVAAAQIYNMLIDYPGRVRVCIDGIAASAASVIAMAGSTVAMGFADNQPAVEVEEVRLGLFTKGNYLAERDRLTTALLDAGLVITGRRYVGFEADTGFHHYGVDIATDHQYS